MHLSLSLSFSLSIYIHVYLWFVSVCITNRCPISYIQYGDIPIMDSPHSTPPHALPSWPRLRRPRHGAGGGGVNPLWVCFNTGYIYIYSYVYAYMYIYIYIYIYVYTLTDLLRLHIRSKTQHNGETNNILGNGRILS